MILAPLLLVWAQERVFGQRVSGEITVPGGGVSEFRVFAEHARVLYRARQASSNLRLHGTLLADGYPNAALGLDQASILRSEELTSDGKLVLFHQDPALYVVPADGSLPPRALSTADEIVTTTSAPDDSRVAYVSIRTGVSGCRVRLVPLDGGRGPLTLAEPASVASKVTLLGERVLVYVRGLAPEVYSVPARGGKVRALSQGLLVDRGFEEWPIARPSPDGRHLVFWADPVQFGRFELFTVPVDGSSPPLRLCSPRRTGESVGRYRDDLVGGVFRDDPIFSFTADGKYVVFFTTTRRGEFFGPRSLHLLKAPVDGHGPAQSLTSWPWPEFFFDEDGGTMNALRVDPTGRRLVYQRATVTFLDNLNRLFAIPVEGGPPVELARDLRPSYGATIGPDGERVVFVARPPTTSEHRLYSVPLDGSLAPVLLTPTIGGNSDVTRFALEGGHALYLADPTNEVFELFQVPIPGGAVPERLNLPLVTGGDVVDFRTRPGQVVYLADQDVNGRPELYLSSLPAGE